MKNVEHYSLSMKRQKTLTLLTLTLPGANDERKPRPTLFSHIEVASAGTGIWLFRPIAGLLLGLFALWLFRPLASSPPGLFVPWLVRPWLVRPWLVHPQAGLPPGFFAPHFGRFTPVGYR